MPRRTAIHRVQSPFVGRDVELRRLRASLTQATEGQGRTILLSGRLGVGKTRMANEVLALARERGVTILRGRAFPLQAEVAFAPFLDAFAPLMRDAGSPHLASLADDLPELGRLFGGPLFPRPELLGDPALEKARLFEAVSRLVQRLTLQAPVALFLDDIHWADSATVDLLFHLALNLSNQSILLIASYEEYKLNSSVNLRTFVVSLQQAGLAEEIEVLPLESAVVTKLVESILNGEAPRDLLALLDSRACGIPLFVEAVVSALIESGSLVYIDKGWWLRNRAAIVLPLHFRLLILERLDKLAVAERHVLDLIAVVGEALSYPILRSISEMGKRELLEALRQLRAEGLVVEGTNRLDVAYSLIHPLYREIACNEVPEQERRLIHMATVRAIESRLEEQSDDLNRLAHHYQGAGSEADSSRALSVMLKAGEQALAVYDNEEAVLHFEGALSILRDGGGWRAEGGERMPSVLFPPPSALPALLERLGEARERVGEYEAAIEAWSEALAERERAGDFVAASPLRGKLALAEWERGNFDVARSHLAAGQAALPNSKPSPELADLQFAHYQILARLGDSAGIAGVAASLLMIAESLKSPRAEAEANLAASALVLRNGDVAGARERAIRALEVSEQSQELALSWRAHVRLVLIGMRMGDHHFIRRHAEQGIEVARKLGSPTMDVFLRSRLAYANLMSGDWDESLRNSAEAVAVARRIGQSNGLAYSMAEQAMILAFRGNLAQAEACISEARLAPGSSRPADRVILGMVDIAEAVLNLERKQAERALIIVRGITAQKRHPVGFSAGVGATMIPEAFMPLALMLLAEAQVATGDAGGALDTALRMIGMGPPDMAYLTALASRAEGLAHQALGETDAAIACLGRAHDIFVASKIPFEAARSLLEKATAAATLQPEEAATAAKLSLATFERLGARRYAQQCRRLLRDLGISVPRTSRAKSSEAILSAREVEVARLVADGLSSAQIAERLFVSRRTVDHHLEHIYVRLGISSRAALARYVSEAGLLSQE